jgi:uncharacterized phage infection (PIP) family protein YhgE
LFKNTDPEQSEKFKQLENSLLEEQRKNEQLCMNLNEVGSDCFSRIAEIRQKSDIEKQQTKLLNERCAHMQTQFDAAMKLHAEEKQKVQSEWEQKYNESLRQAETLKEQIRKLTAPAVVPSEKITSNKKEEELIYKGQFRGIDSIDTVPRERTYLRKPRSVNC